MGGRDSPMKLNLLRYEDMLSSLWIGGTPYGNKINSLMRGVFSVGGSDSLMVMRKTVMESRAEIPRVTYTKKRHLTLFFYQNLINFINL